MSEAVMPVTCVPLGSGFDARLLRCYVPLMSVTAEHRNLLPFINNLSGKSRLNNFYTSRTVRRHPEIDNVTTAEAVMRN
jgi:hypothetical protein